MKICFVSSAHPKFDKRVFQKEAKNLAEKGHVVEHLAPGSESLEYDEQGVRIVEYPARSGLVGRVLQAHRIYAEAKSRNADFYHANEFDSWLVCLLLKITKTCQVVFDIHEFYPEMFASRRFPRALQPMARGVIKAFYRMFMPFTDHIVLANRHIISDIPQGARDKCVIVENFGHRPSVSDDFDGSATASRDDDTLRIIHVGLLNQERGSIALLDALRKMESKNVEVSLIGQITDMPVDAYRSEVESRNLSDIVKVVDWMPYDQLVQELQKADIGFVFFLGASDTNKYGLPHKLFDYMTNGLAVVSSEHAEYVSEIVTDAEAGWVVDPENPIELANFFDGLLGKRAEIKKLGSSGRQAVLEKYNWEREFEKLERIYQSDVHS